MSTMLDLAKERDKLKNYDPTGHKDFIRKNRNNFCHVNCNCSDGKIGTVTGREILDEERNHPLLIDFLSCPDEYEE